MSVSITWLYTSCSSLIFFKDNRCEPNDSPNNSFLVKPRSLFDEDGENPTSKLPTDEMDSERSEDESLAQGYNMP